MSQTGPVANSTNRWAALQALVRPDAMRWGGLAALVAVASALLVTGPLLVRRIVDLADRGASQGSIVQVAVLFLAVAVATHAVNLVVTWLATVTAWRTTNELRVRLARHTLSLDHEFHRAHTPGELIQRIDGDVTSVSDLLGVVAPKAAGALITTVGIVAVVAVLDWFVALCMAVYIAAAAWMVLRGRHRAVAEAADEMSASAHLYGGIEERLTASEDLRSNGAASHVLWRFTQESADVWRTSVGRSRAFMRLWWRVEGAVAAGSALALAGGALLVRSGSITLGTAFVLFQYVLLISRPLEDLVEQLETVQKANGAMIRVAALLDERPTIVDTGVKEPPPGALEVCFDDVSFAYGDGQRVLNGVSFAVPAGATVGIVGHSGGGKTTISRLALRLVEATGGEVRLGGVPIAEVPMRSLRRRVASIPQEVELFTGSVRDNVTLFRGDVPDGEVIDALHAVGLGELAAGGIHRQLGAAGAGLSAGEAQLLALARVWLRRPDVIVLDEATARVDPVTEARIEAAVRTLIAGRTTLIIAHRLTTLDHVDHILVVEHGRVAEFGAREQLSERIGGRFHHLLDVSMGDDSHRDDGSGDEDHGADTAVDDQGVPA
jgi:ATP-binding cassette, subfamily B, bacterial